MRTLEAAFTRLLGRQPSDRERQDLYRTRDALNLKDDDAMWLLLLALGHYETLYRELPALISDAAAATLEKVKDSAEAQVKASAAAATQELTSALVRKAARETPQAAKSRILTWAVAILATSGISPSVAGWFAHRHGVASGFSTGWAEARRKCADEKAAAAWANTAEGKLAYALARAGSIRDLANCSGLGWVQRGGICFARAYKGAVSGWRLPTTANPDDRER